MQDRKGFIKNTSLQTPKVFIELKKSYKRISKQKGLTLIELLTVISVIALLLGILLPAVNKARSVARRTACRGNLHTIAIAFRMYRDEYWDVMPPACQFPSIEDPNEPESKPAITAT